jgi:SAM-dependent methyltransferase
MRAIIAALALALGAWSAAHAQHGTQPMHRSFDDAERWAQVFDDPARDAWQKPDEVVRALHLAPNTAAADIGAGTGYFAVRLARAVPQGRVYGVDISPDMVRYLNERAAREKLPNLSAQLGDAAGPKLPAPVDLVLVVNTYHHIGDRAAYFERVRASLKPGGRVAIIDYRPDASSGPPPRARIAPERVKEEMARAGYRVAEEHAFLPQQFFLVLTPK